MLNSGVNFTLHLSLIDLHRAALIQTMLDLISNFE